MANVSPSPKLQFLDSAGNPLVGGKLYTYSAGTTTPLATYTDAGGLTSNANPVILDSRGEANVWLGTSQYKFKLTTSADVELWTVDNLNAADAVTLNALAASTGSSLVGFVQSGAGAVATTVQTKLRESVSVFDFMTVAQISDVQSGIGSIDVVGAINAAISAIKLSGGGLLLFPAGRYLLASTTFDGHRTSHFNIAASEGICFSGYGAHLVSSYSSSTETAVIFYGDGVRSVEFEGFEFSSNFSRNPNTATVTNYGASGFYFRNTERDGELISIKEIKASSVYYFLSTGQPTAADYRTRTISIDNCFIAGGYYGLLFQNNGDNVKAHYRTFGLLRSYFAYGVDTHVVQYQSFGGDALTDCLIKAYDRNTTNLSIRARVVSNTSADAKCTIESQHPPSTQPVPCRLINICVDLDDSQSVGSKSLRFAYYQDTPTPTETPTCAYNLFNGITLAGYSRNQCDIAVTQAVSGRLDIDDLISTSPDSSIFTGKGFLRTQESGTWIPVLTDGDLNGDEGQTSSLAVGTYKKIGNLVYFFGRIRMTGLGTLNTTAAASIIGLPYRSSADASILSSVVFNYCQNLNLSGVVTVSGYVGTSVSHISVVKWSATTGTSGLAISEVSSDGELAFSGCYAVE